MGKSKKNKDFQKVKLKVGKRLKKADNVTNASFKTRTIQISQQLKSESKEPSTKRKLTIQELLNQCQHYNISVKHDAVVGLKELLSEHPHLIRCNLAVILEKVCALFGDKDGVVRSSVIKLLKAIIPHIQERQISSFFPTISAHLCCCMTHIYEDIRSDSLQILDIFLNEFPNLLVDKSSQILPNFIEMISNVKSTEKPSKSNTSGRSLIINPNSKISSQKWRAKVLNRLYKLLVAVYKTQDSMLEPKNNDHSTLSYGWKIRNEVHWSKDAGKCCVQPISSMFYHQAYNKDMSFRLDSATTKEKDPMKTGGLFTDVESLSKYVQTLVPLLLECWLEADTSFNSGSSGMVHVDSLSLRKNILCVILLLLKCLQRHDLGSSGQLQHLFLKDFEHYFMTRFPYSIYANVNKTKKKKNESDEDTCIDDINLAVCEVMVSFIRCNENISCESQRIFLWQPKICTFLMHFLQDEETTLDNSQTVVDILMSLLESKTASDDLKYIISACMERYKKMHPRSNGKKVFLSFFCSAILNDQLEMKLDAELKSDLLKTLPDVFGSQKTSVETLSLIALVVKRLHCTHTCQGQAIEVSKKLLQIVIDAMQDVSVCTLKSVLELMYYFPEIDDTTQTLVLKMCTSRMVSCDIKLYGLQILQHRFRKVSFPLKDIGCQIGLCLSILLASMEKRSTDLVVTCDEVEVVGTNDLDLLQETMIITKGISDILLQSDHCDQVMHMIANHLTAYIRDSSYLHLCQAVSMIILANQTQLWKQPAATELLHTLCSFAWVVLYSVHFDGKLSATDFAQNIESIVKTFLVSFGPGISMYLQRAISMISHADVQKLEVVCYTCSLLFKTAECRNAVKYRGSVPLKAFMDKMKDFHPMVAETQWWSDFVYLVKSNL